MRDNWKKNNLYLLRKPKTILALLFLLTVSLTLPSTSLVAALNKANIYVFANPNPVGVNQQAVIAGWITPLPVFNTFPFVYWTGITVEITKPDGTIDKFGPLQCDSAGSFWFNYIPTQLGSYSVKASWDGNATSPAQAFIYSPTTATYQFATQQQEVQTWPSAPLPDGYWQRPINSENREWNILGGSWLYVNGPARSGYDSTGRDYQPYSKAPNTPHINWVLQATQGGIIGGAGTTEYQNGTYGEAISTAKFVDHADMLIIAGLGYYVDQWTLLPTSGGNTGLIPPAYPDVPKSNQLSTFTLHCVDLRTGKELWQRPTFTYGVAPNAGGGRIGAMFRGQIEPIPKEFSSGSAGPKSFILSIGSTFVRWDAYTGLQLFLMNNSLSGTFDNSRFVYSTSSGRLIKWDTMGLAANLNASIKSAAVYNVTAPSVKYGNTTSYLSVGTISEDNDIGIASYSVRYADGVAPGIAGIDLKTGTLMWNNTLYGYEGGEGTGCIGYGKYFYMAGDAAWHAFDIKTGAELWKSEAGILPWGKFWGYSVACAYNKLYAECYDGYIRAFDVETGKTLWKYFSGSSGFETPYGEWPWFSVPVIADGKLYASLSEHSPTNPNWRGGKLYCFDANSGQVLWTLPWLGGCKAIADGFMVAENEYDGQVYCFGKGLSATTVTAPSTEVTLGSQVLIKGTVTDQSPGKTCLGIPAAGTPAISDASMSDWMAYLYMQKPKPTSANGVPVQLQAVDSNGNTVDVGTATSNAEGNYYISWTPPNSGIYKVTAKFQGTESYYSSNAETGIVVSKTGSPSPTSGPGQTTNQISAEAFYAFAAIMVILFVVLAVLIVRKK